jgi:hypothetical protein
MLEIKILNPEPSGDNLVWILKSNESNKQVIVHVALEWLAFLLHIQ